VEHLRVPLISALLLGGCGTPRAVPPVQLYDRVVVETEVITKANTGTGVAQVRVVLTAADEQEGSISAQVDGKKVDVAPDATDLPLHLHKGRNDLVFPVTLGASSRVTVIWTPRPEHVDGR
jgi:hypothetical protein